MIKIYTDGSCRDTNGGWAFILIEDEIPRYNIRGSEKNTTNNRMELTAVIEALKFCKTDVIEIFTDSKYVINGITEWIYGWIKNDWKNIKNKDLWLILFEQSKNKKIDWRWVKSHDGNEFNEMADRFAKMGMIEN